MSIISDVLQAIGGSAGAAVSAPVQAAGGIAELIKGVIDRVSPDPQAAAAMKLQVDQLHQATHFKEIDAALEQGKTDATVLVAQQQAFAAEAAGQGWLERNWHALGCLYAIFLISAIYFLLPILHKEVPDVPESAWLMIGSVLGITTWKKGDSQIAKAKAIGATGAAAAGAS